MGSKWVDHPSWELVDEASDASGRDIARLLLEADADELKATRNSQMATFVLSMVVLDAVERIGLAPAIAAGHSLGEYSALTATGVISFEDGVRLVAERGEAMQDAADATTGTMAAILGLDDDKVVEACDSVDDEVWVANYNAPGQVVIAGSPAGIEAAGLAAKGLGAKRAMPLPVSGAFHTPFMASAGERLGKALDSVRYRSPAVPVVTNVDAAAHRSADDWLDLLTAQLTSPVRWRQSLYRLEELGVLSFLELGPGAALTGMAKRTCRGAATVSVAKPADLDNLIANLESNNTSPTSSAGENLYVTERVVVTPGAGLFTPRDGLEVGVQLAVGEALGQVGEDPVVSPFAGTVMGIMAYDGERVTARQPVVWLRTA
ncbi:MAG: ACP S-malonyltransferase [Actinomycetia bacterium]|nr:ACP S-malonyltransferase [Actinomycetes bacterium]MCP4958793.1 ACP S-malonyltransferase [Actinomycetes bacterium]